MSLSQALGTAVAGLRVTQSGMSLVAANVANAETQGYLKKRLTQITTQASGAGVSVRTAAVNRQLDIFLQRQLRVEVAGGAYAGARAELYLRLQQVYGQPGTDSALETIFNAFTGALQNLATSPESASARTAVLSSAQVLAQQLNSMTDDIQALRTDTELGLAAAVQQANSAMQQIARINSQLGTSSQTDATTAVLLDQRDFYIDQLSQLMDIRVSQSDANQVTVFTNSGIQLVSTQASSLRFDAQGTVVPSAVWSADPAERTLGTITLVSPNGGSLDLIGNRAIRSGRIAALLEMRDEIFPEAQAQLDEMAAAMASALSDRTTAGAAVTAGAQSGFSVDVAGLLDGNRIHLTYTDSSNTQRQVTIIRVDDAAVLPLADDVTANPSDRVIGVDFSGGMASIVAQLNQALGSTGLQFSNPGGSLLEVLDDGLGNQVDVDALAATATVTGLTGGSAEFPFFLDGGTPYSGAISSLGPQSVGLAGRIGVNAALLADPTRLIVYQTAPQTAAGDATRPTFIYDRLTNAILDYSPRAGVGTLASPFSGTLSAYMRQVVSQQGDAAATAVSLQQGQDIVVNALLQRFSDQSSVNIDEEMATLLTLQTAYGANARVMTTVKEMFELLMRI